MYTRDNDCNGLMAAVELDCDDDGSMPDLPRIGTAVLSADDAGLAACDPEAATTESFSCWDGEELTLECDSVTLLWSLRYGDSDDQFGGRFDGGRRIYSTTNACDSIGDCDDHCALRCRGGTESCDGIDNDCTGVVYDTTEDTPSFPPAMLTTIAASGSLEVAETDFDLDGYLDCDSFQADASYEFFRSTAGCADQVVDEALLVDCNPACAIASPEGTEVCDGALNLCGGEAEGTEADVDGHTTCGAWGAADTAVPDEVLYVPVWIDTSTDLGLDRPRVIPLIMPRVVLCDPAAEVGTDGADSECIAACDEELKLALDWLLGWTEGDSLVEAMLLNADPVGTASDLVHDLCFVPTDDTDTRAEHTQAGTCGIVSLTLDTTSDASLGDTLATLVDGSTVNSELPSDSTWGDAGTAFDRMTACLDAPEQYALRTVWNAERVAEARTAVAEVECLRMFDDVAACADLEDYSRIRSDFTLRTAAAAELTSRVFWQAELGNLAPADVPDGTLMECWGDPVAAAVDTTTGGDCSDDASGAHRDNPEGPWDLRALYDRDVFGNAAAPLTCDLCIDGIDNNCDGLIDCEDPSCAACFVGIGGGCYDAASPCAPGAACTSEGRRDAPVAAFAWLLVMVVGVRLERRLRR